MSVVARLGLFAAGLAVVFVAAFGVGRALGPDDGRPSPTSVPMSEQMDMGS
jgi:hypothetical protein